MLLDRKLSFYLKSIGVKRDKLKYFIDFDIMPKSLVLKWLQRVTLCPNSQQYLPHDKTPATRSHDFGLV